MNLASAFDIARRGQLYPSVILHGGTDDARRQAALDLGRTLLCEVDDEIRPCGVCRHCRRIAWPEEGVGETPFHPDFQVLLRDTKTSTSVDAAREFLKSAQVAPFEARGQVFAFASAESLTGEAANALLKALEEPYVSAPRHFFLLAPSRLDLLATLRSRSLSIFLGASEPLDTHKTSELAGAFAAAITAYGASRSPIHLLSAAAVLGKAGTWDDARSTRPWSAAAAAVVAALDSLERCQVPLRPALALAEALLEAPAWRLRGISAERILEGLVSRHLA